MHCVSSYPLMPEFVNMNKFFNLKNLTNKVGYSGHFQEIDDAVFALCLGANYIEKHFTTNNELAGRDNKFALNQEKFSKLNLFRKNIELMKKERGLNIQKCEMEIFKKYRGRWGK
jgi:sialic acid synthase SpsE